MMLYLNKKEVNHKPLIVSTPSYQESTVGKNRASFIKCTSRKVQEEQVSIDFIQHDGLKSRLSDSALSCMSVEERTRLYQEKYEHIIVAENVLRSWIKTNKEKGPPLELSEAYRPPSRTRLASVSMPCPQSKRRSLLVHLNRECDPTTPSPKASFSTFLKKAIRPSESSSNKQKLTPRPSVTCSASKSIGFSLGNSFNRLSSSKQPHSADRRSSTGQVKASDMTPFSEKPCLSQKGHVGKRDTQPRLLSITECPKPNGHLTVPTKKGIRPHSTIVPYSPSSIFLDRLQLSGIYEENGHQTVQSNTYSKSKSHHSTEHRQVGARPESLILTHDLAESAETRSIDRTSLQANHGERRTGGSVKDPSHSRRGPTLQTLAERHPLTLIHSTKETKQKKRMSFSLGPSLSSLRLIPQKTPTLKRQSMLA